MVWSPDGRQTAVTRNLPHSVGIAQPDFAYIMNADGSGIRPIYRQDDVQGGQRLLSVGTSELAWTPSSDAIVVAGEVFDLAGHRRGKVAEAADAVSWGQPAGSRTPCPSGYWLVAPNGGIFPFGDARIHATTATINLNTPHLRLTPTPTRT